MITTGYLKSIQPKRGRPTKVVPDGKVGGLQARIGARGRVEFSLVYRVARDPHQIRRRLGYWWNDDLGPAPSDRWISLDQARIAALTLKDAATRGHPDAWAFAPAPVKQEPVPLPADVVEAVVTRYAREHLRTLRTGPAVEKVLRQSLPLDRPISAVTRADVRKVLDGHMARGKGALANRVYSLLSTFFAWAVDRDLVEASPMAGMARPMRKEVSRDRVLDDEELATVWGAVEVMTPARRDCIRFLMLTGLRRSEASELLWSDIAGDLLTIPAARAKNNMAHLVPLSPQALSLIGAPNGSERVFDFDGKRADLSTYTANLAKTLTLPDWRLHDLRRSFASGLQRLGVKPEVIDRCLGHSNVVKGTAAVYLREAYLPERRAAMELWSEHVERITT
jgi:integrase